MKRKIRQEEDLTTRPLLGKMIRFSLPLILTGLLQLLYSATDMVVVGRFAGETAMAAVGSTGALVNLVTNLFIGLGVGALAAMSRWVGARNERRADGVVHTAVALSLIGGVVVAVFGFFMSRILLEAMDSPANVLPQSTLYLQIYFLGMPVTLLYNFGGSIMRACGDTKRPLLFLAAAGVVNVGLDLIAVVWLKMGVAGAAIATVAAQATACALVVICLMRRKGYGQFRWRKLRLEKAAVKDIIGVGLPAGIQSTIFSLSNVLIQSSINAFGDIAMAGNAAAGNVEGFVYVAMNAVAQSCLTFTGQNYGAHKPENMTLALWQALGLATVVGLVLGLGVYFAGNFLLGIYNSNPEVIAYGLERLSVICTCYLLCGILETLASSLRGMGSSIVPMAMSILGVVGVRIVYIYTVFRAYHTLLVLYLSYPVSWLFTCIAHMVCLLLVRKRVYRRLREAAPVQQEVEL